MASEVWKCELFVEFCSMCVCVCVCLTSQQKLYGQMEMRLLLSIIQKTLEAGTLIPDFLGHLGEQLIDYINVSPQWSM